jgi:hypothetical protein
MLLTFTGLTAVVSVAVQFRFAVKTALPVKVATIVPLDKVAVSATMCGLDTCVPLWLYTVTLFWTHPDAAAFRLPDESICKHLVLTGAIAANCGTPDVLNEKQVEGLDDVPQVKVYCDERRIRGMNRPVTLSEESSQTCPPLR